MPKTSTKRVQRALLAGTAAVALMAVAPALLPDSPALRFVQPASAAANVQISFFFDSLAPEGHWVRHPRYEYVFIPDVDRGWRPYTHGHWVYTKRYGWYWQSDEPFAWAVYHYGRWGYDPAYGWFWVPGTEWAPAWVSWRRGGGHVGWAPAAPHGRGYVVGHVDYYEPPVVEAWVFVPEQRFVAVDVSSYVLPVAEINVVLGKTRARYHVRRHDGFVVNSFLSRDRVRTFVKQDITVYNITEADDRDQSRQAARKSGDRKGGSELKVYRPQVAEKKPDRKPEKALESPDKIEKKPTLQQTARGEKPKDAPPSAAELKPGASAQGDDKQQAKDADQSGDKQQAKQSDEKPDGKQEVKQPDSQSDGKQEARQGEEKPADKQQTRQSDEPSEDKAKAKADDRPDADKQRAERRDGQKPDQNKGNAEMRKERGKAKAEQEAPGEARRPDRNAGKPQKGDDTGDAPRKESRGGKKPAPDVEQTGSLKAPQEGGPQDGNDGPAQPGPQKRAGDGGGEQGQRPKIN